MHPRAVGGRKNAIVIAKPTMMIHLPVAAKQEGRSNNWTNDPVQNAVVYSVRIAGTIIHRRSMWLALTNSLRSNTLSGGHGTHGTSAAFWNLHSHDGFNVRYQPVQPPLMFAEQSARYISR